MAEGNGKDPAGGYVTVDPKKMGKDGWLMMGEVNSLVRWVVAFDAMRERSTDMIERKFLSEICSALNDDAERIKIEFAKYAIARGAGQMVDKPADPPAQNAPSSVTEN